jgi:thiol-disulfide isomerase/thioredoxin
MRFRFVDFSSFPQGWIVLGVSLIFPLVLSLSCQAPQKQTLANEDSTNSFTKIDQSAFIFETLTGDTIALTPLETQWTVLHFWATWCKPCLAEFPELSHSLPRLASESVQFFFASDEELAEIILFEKKYTTGLDLVRMKKGSLADFEIYALPTTIVLDREGKEVFRHAGQLRWGEFNSIEELIAQKP